MLKSAAATGWLSSLGGFVGDIGSCPLQDEGCAAAHLTLGCNRLSPEVWISKQYNSLGLCQCPPRSLPPAPQRWCSCRCWGCSARSRPRQCSCGSSSSSSAQRRARVRSRNSNTAVSAAWWSTEPEHACWRQGVAGSRISVSAICSGRCCVSLTTADVSLLHTLLPLTLCG